MAVQTLNIDSSVVVPVVVQESLLKPGDFTKIKVIEGIAQDQASREASQHGGW